MGITAKTAGAWASGSTSVSPALPSSPNSNTRMVLFVGCKPFNATINTPSGWTLLSAGGGANGSTAAGIDTGSVLWATFYRDWQSGDAAPTVSVTSGNVSLAVINGFDKASTDTWQTPVAGKGSDTTSGTGFSITSDVDVGIGAGDFIVHGAVIAGNNATFGTPTLTATGCTFGTVTESPSTEGSTATGNDLEASAFYAQCTAGPSSAAPVAGWTLSVAQTGGGSVVRLRVDPNVALTSTGATATGDVGTVGVSSTVALTGVAGAGAVGTVTYVVAVPDQPADIILHGDDDEEWPRTLVDGYQQKNHDIQPWDLEQPYDDLEYDHHEGGTSPVDLVAVEIALTGVSGAGAVGAVGVVFGLAASGNEAAAAVGTAGVQSAVGVLGASASGAVGSVSPVATTEEIAESFDAEFIDDDPPQQIVDGYQQKDHDAMQPWSSPAADDEEDYVAHDGSTDPVEIAAETSAALTGVAATGAVGAAGVEFTVALTGVSGTSDIGALGVAHANALTAEGAVGAVGSAAPSRALALTGQAGTGAAGTLGVEHANTLTGVEGIGAVGAVTTGSDLTLAITGVAGTGVVGSLGVSHDNAVTGNAGTGAVGAVGVASTAAAAGVAGTGAAGAAGVQHSNPLTGVAGAGAVGAVSADASAPQQPQDILLHGDDDDPALAVAVDGYQQRDNVVVNDIPQSFAAEVDDDPPSQLVIDGYQQRNNPPQAEMLPQSFEADVVVYWDGDDDLDIADDYDNTDPDQPWDEPPLWFDDDYDEHNGSTDPPLIPTRLTGVQAAGIVTPMNAVTSVNPTGVAATGAVGSVDNATTIGLTGVAATGAVGTLTATTPSSAALTGVQAAGAAGVLGSVHTVALTGVGATAAVGTLAPVSARSLSGVSAAAAVGGVDNATTIVLTGAVALGEVGSVATPDSTPISGVEAAGLIGTPAAAMTVALTGVQATSAVGSVANGARLVPLTGIVATGFTGVLSSARTVGTLTGVAATSAVGSVFADYGPTLTGVQATLFVGSVQASSLVMRSLTGVSATGLAGTLTSSGGTGAASVITGQAFVFTFQPAAWVYTTTPGIVIRTETLQAFVLVEPGQSAVPPT